MNQKPVFLTTLKSSQNQVAGDCNRDLLGSQSYTMSIAGGMKGKQHTSQHRRKPGRVSHCLPSSSDPSDLPVSLHLAFSSLHLFSVLLVLILPATTTLQVWFKQSITQIPFIPFQTDLSGQQNKHN